MTSNHLTLEKIIKGKIAIFIDAANIELSAKDSGWRVDYKKLHRWIRGLGKLTYVGFFSVRFATQNHDAFLTMLKKTGFSLVTKPLKLIKNKTNKGHLRKANFDVEIAVETMKRITSFETMILFSGDSDFAYLLKELKKSNKIIVVVSMRYHIAKELIEKSNAYVDLRKVRRLIERKKQ